jgi:hypothetical protein
MSAYINWPMMASDYQNLAFHDEGLITANQPWSGAYSVSRTLWSIAQTTQFTSPGWKVPRQRLRPPRRRPLQRRHRRAPTRSGRSAYRGS